MSQGDLFRDEGMARVDGKTHPAWKAEADRVIIALARRGIEFTAEDVTAIAGMPANPNAVGARMSAAAKRGIIEPVAYRQATRTSRHSSRMLTWRGTVLAATAEPPIPLRTPTPRRESGPKDFRVKQSDLVKCPDHNFGMDHWRPDGTCLHMEPKPWRCTVCGARFTDKQVVPMLASNYATVGCSICLSKRTARRDS